MLRVATAAQMRDLDRKTIQDYHVPGLLLTEAAAMRVIEVLVDRFCPLKEKKVAVVCGPGNNGGDGLAIARLLATHHEARVTVWLLGDPEKLHDEAAANYKMANAYGVVIKSGLGINLSSAEIIVDALFGTGMKSAVTGDAAKLIRSINESGKPVVSVDIPSGLKSDSGEVDGPVVSATITVTFTCPKLGLLEYPGASYVGELVVADIGTPHSVIKASSIHSYLAESQDVSEWLPRRANGRDTNKGTFGHVLAFAGSRDFSGAPVLVANAASYTGAGLVTLAVPEGIRMEAASRVAPVVMIRGMAKTTDGQFAARAIEAALTLANKATAVALGPGLGQSEGASEFVRSFIGQCPVPLVIDADGLNLLSKLPDRGVTLVNGRPSSTILTPHPGEMGRLVGIPAREVQKKRREVVQQVAKAYGSVVLLKGARTLIADSDGALFLNRTGNPGMASGGMGDALTGVIVALLAQGLSPLHAAAGGAYLHGLAGDLASKAQEGPTGLIATSLIGQIPKAIATCQNSRSDSASRARSIHQTENDGRRDGLLIQAA